MARAKRLYGSIKIRSRGRLPHWESESADYFVTFRLEDSLPQSVLRSFEFERKDILQTARQQGRELSSAERKRLQELFSERIEAYLDNGAGACHLAKPEIADLVAGALCFFDEERYRLSAWTVMPNHVHVVSTSFPGWFLEKILHSWKSFTSNEANKILCLSGELWGREYYDHLIRDEEELARIIQYVRENPGRARLRDWKWVWARKG